MKLGQGTNISHWLSQSERRRAWFKEEDVRRIADWGFDHIRLPIDEVQLWDDAGRQRDDAFDLLNSALDWAERAGLKVVVDLHILRSHFFNQATEPALFTAPAGAEKFAWLWQQLSAQLKCRPTGSVAYELLNEPVATDHKDWNRVATMAFQTIRKAEPDRTILLGSNRWNSVLTFDELHVPDDSHTILTFHFYHPMLVTHHQAHWCWEGRLYDGPIHYPGRPVCAEEMAKLDDETRNRLMPINGKYDRNAMIADLAKPLALARRTGRPLYCGEFGVIDRAPHLVRLAWYRDLLSVLDEYGIGWANWDYNGCFGLVDADGRSTGIAEAMLSGKRRVS